MAVERRIPRAEFWPLKGRREGTGLLGTGIVLVFVESVSVGTWPEGEGGYASDEDGGSGTRIGAFEVDAGLDLVLDHSLAVEKSAQGRGHGNNSGRTSFQISGRGDATKAAAG